MLRAARAGPRRAREQPARRGLPRLHHVARAGSATATRSSRGSPPRPWPTASSRSSSRSAPSLDDDRRRLALAREAVGPDIAHRDRRQPALGRRRTPIAWMQQARRVRPVLDRGADQPRTTSSATPRSGAAVAPIRVATGEHAQNRVLFKQLLQAGADRRRADRRLPRRRRERERRRSSCWPRSSASRSARTPAASACARWSSTWRCSTSSRVSGRCDGRAIEYVDHLHEHFVDPVVDRATAGTSRPTRAGLSAQMRESVARVTPRGGPAARSVEPRRLMRAAAYRRGSDVASRSSTCPPCAPDRRAGADRRSPTPASAAPTCTSCTATMDARVRTPADHRPRDVRHGRRRRRGRRRAARRATPSRSCRSTGAGAAPPAGPAISTSARTSTSSASTRRGRCRRCGPCRPDIARPACRRALRCAPRPWSSPTAVAVHDVAPGRALGRRAGRRRRRRTVGPLIALVARAEGADVLLLEPDPFRRGVGERLGTRVARPAGGRRRPPRSRDLDRRRRRRRRLRGLGRGGARRAHRPGRAGRARAGWSSSPSTPSRRPLDLHRIFWRELDAVRRPGLRAGRLRACGRAARDRRDPRRRRSSPRRAARAHAGRLRDAGGRRRRDEGPGRLPRGRAHDRRRPAVERLRPHRPMPRRRHRRTARHRLGDGRRRWRAAGADVVGVSADHRGRRAAARERVEAHGRRFWATAADFARPRRGPRAVVAACAARPSGRHPRQQRRDHLPGTRRRAPGRRMGPRAGGQPHGASSC